MRKTYLYPFTPIGQKDTFQLSAQRSVQPIPTYQFHLLQKFSDRLRHAVFTREGGVSKGAFESLNVRFGIGDSDESVKENRLRISRCFGVEDGGIIAADQTHSNHVARVGYEHVRYLQKPWDAFEDVDALVTANLNIPLMIQVADCQALLMYDPVKNVAGAVHAGWKGLMRNISEETLQVLQENYGVDPADVLVGISPSLGPCCSFFSEPEKELPQKFHSYIDRQKRVDLWAFSLAQLQKQGIKKEHIELARICTQCGGDGTHQLHRLSDQNWKNKFFSFRGDRGITGRFGAVISLV